MNGLDITEEQFMQMGTKEQNLMLFRNLVHIRSKFKDYKVHRKVQYVWLVVLTTLLCGFAGLRKYIPI